MLRPTQRLIPVLLALAGGLAAAQSADKPKAVALVKEAIALAKASGKDALVKQINFGSGRFHVGPGRPLYLFVYDGTGKCIAHGSTANFVGSNRLGVKDPDGKPYIAELIQLGKSAGKGWVDYQFVNPADGKVEPKTSYVEALDDWAVCCGIYR
jgi:cytochrome c